MENWESFISEILNRRYIKKMGDNCLINKISKDESTEFNSINSISIKVKLSGTGEEQLERIELGLLVKRVRGFYEI